MKRLIPLALVAAMGLPLFAQDADDGEVVKAQPREERTRDSNMWPAFMAVSEFPASPDVLGLRLTIPYSTVQENVTGIDFGLWGRAQYFQGIQLNLLRSDVKDDMAGFQVGVYNTVGGGQLLGIQAGLFNEASCLRGAQVGLINLGGQVEGLQIGLINRSDTMVGYQIGLINVIRDNELQFFPIVNIGW